MENICRGGGNNYNRSSSQGLKGAVSLKNTLVEAEPDLEYKIFLWQLAINEADPSRQRIFEIGPNLRAEMNKKKQAFDNVAKWYLENSRFFGLESPMSDPWNVTVEQRERLRTFRKDPFYYLKNMAEIIFRDVLSVELRKRFSDSIKIKMSTERDDVFGKVDFIVESTIGARRAERKEYLGVDLYISKNYPKIPAEKLKPTAKCLDFQEIKRKMGEEISEEIPRIVFNIPNDQAARFIVKYMDQIENNGRVSSTEASLLFEKSFDAQTIADIFSRTKEQTYNILY